MDLNPYTFVPNLFFSKSGIEIYITDYVTPTGEGLSERGESMFGAFYTPPLNGCRMPRIPKPWVTLNGDEIEVCLKASSVPEIRTQYDSFPLRNPIINVQMVLTIDPNTAEKVPAARGAFGRVCHYTILIRFPDEGGAPGACAWVNYLIPRVHFNNSCGGQVEVVLDPDLHLMDASGRPIQGFYTRTNAV